MIFTLPSFTVLASLVFLLALLMNLVRKNTTLVILYLLQSAAVGMALIMLAYSEGAVGLLSAGILTLAVKAVMAPVFLLRLIKRYSAHFSAASYLAAPRSLAVLAVITAVSYLFIAPALSAYSDAPSIPILFSSIFSVLFLMINRRGALAAIVGILSLENGVVLLTAFLGLAHSSALEFAIAFDIAAWIAIAAAFLTMMYRQFGIVDAATLSMTHLTEE